MQIDYTSRDFASLKADLISLISQRTATSASTWNPTDYSDLGNVLVEAFSYMGDVMSHYLDRVANETSIDTAIQSDTLLSFANLYDYHPSGPTPAAISLTFTNNSTSSIDLPVGTQVMAPLSYGNYTQAYFETTQAATGLAPSAQITLTALEGKTVNTDRPDLINQTYNKPLPSNLGTSNGTPNQSFTIIDVNIIDSSIKVYVGQSVAFNSWTYVDSLLEYGPGDTVFTTTRSSDGTTSILFGDGINGSIPLQGQLISSLYKTSVGIAGNVKAQSVTEVTFIPGNTNVQAPAYLSVTNQYPATGGADPVSSTNIRQHIKNAVSSRGRAVTLSDYGYLASLVSQVGKANASSSVYSSVNLYIQPTNDGSAAPGYPQATLVSALANGTNIVYTTDYKGHNFAVGDFVNISGFTPTSLNLQGAQISAIQVATPSTTFTITNTLSATSNTNSGGYAIDLTPTYAFTNTLVPAVQAYMAPTIPAGVTLTVAPPTYVPVYLSLSVIAQPSYRNADVKLAVYQAMLGTGGLFEYSNNLFGDTIYLSSIISAVNNIPGVVSSTVTQLNIDGSSSVAVQTATVTAATATGTYITYVANNTFQPGEVVTISGLSSLNLTNVTVYSATPTQFVVANGAAAASVTGASGTATVNGAITLAPNQIPFLVNTSLVTTVSGGINS